MHISRLSPFCSCCLWSPPGWKLQNILVNKLNSSDWQSLIANLIKSLCFTPIFFSSPHLDYHVFNALYICFLFKFWGWNLEYFTCPFLDFLGILVLGILVVGILVLGMCFLGLRLGVVILTFWGWNGGDLGILHSSLFISALGGHPPQQTFFYELKCTLYIKEKDDVEEMKLTCDKVAKKKISRSWQGKILWKR